MRPFSLNYSPLGLIFLLLFSLRGSSQGNEHFFSADHHELKRPIGYGKMVEFLESAAEKDFIDLTKAGHTPQRWSLYLVHLFHGEEESIWRVFFFAQQHGNEPAGKDALLYLIREIAENPEILPEDVELWVIPMLNPDGAEADQRQNANGMDLNRDHQLLSQPETLHRIFRQIMPHIAVDCHEFGRDSEDYTKKGWQEWPQILMDCANNPQIRRQENGRRCRWNPPCCMDYINILNSKK